MKLIVFGDFNCPYSYLASVRADALVEAGKAQVEWRAVEHDQNIPTPSALVEGELAGMFDREIAEVRGLLQPGETFTIHRPPVQPNTAAAIAEFAETAPADADDLRRRLFTALWVGGADIGELDVLRELQGTVTEDGHRRADAWRDAWLGIERRMVPMLVLPNGDVSRGLGALARLTDLSR